jgi:adenine-specific DNA methylase
MGFVRWGDLYTRRQVEILLDAFATIRSLPHPKAVKDRLAFAVIGCAEMPAFLSRWDRTALKPFEALANHRYAHTTLAVEMNPVAPVGRGTFAKRLASAKKSLGWLSSECGNLPKVTRVLATDTRVSPETGGVVVATGSSKAQPIPNGTVRLVLSDPPYLDDVQYGELARLFHLWLSVYTPIAAADESAEAVPNSTRGTDVNFYQNAIASCLAESQRTLASRGRLVLTFHNTKLVAWQALAGALHESGFDVCAIAVVYAENGTDLCKRNVNSMLHDLVLECCARRRSRGPVQIAITPKSVAEKNLIAVGLALAEATRSGNAGELPTLYGSQLKRFGTTRRTIR